jgi:hypothetical protein
VYSSAQTLKIVEIAIAERFASKLHEPVFVPCGYFKSFDGISQSKQFSFELKFEVTARQTGNFCIEYSYRGHPSGLAGTSALWWIAAFPLDREKVVCYQFDVERLRDAMKRFPLFTGGDRQASRFKLLPVQLAEELKADKFVLNINWKHFQPYWN